MTGKTTQALTGIKILDFTQVLAGPFATQQLAQLGAQVIKIEQPGTGDMTRGLMSASSDGMSPSFLTCNLGKRSLALDLKHLQAKEVIFKLVSEADAVVENFKPGTIERLGYGYEAIKAVKPDIVYASISGFGQAGPKANQPAFDGAIQAFSGMMSISGHPESGPVRSGYFSVDMSTALNAAFAITAALLRRHVTGEGQRIDISMLDTAMMMQAPQMTAYTVNDVLPELVGNRSPTKQPTSNVFESLDGHVQIIAMKESQVLNLFRVLGHEQDYAKYSDPELRLKQTEEINAILRPLISSQNTAHWLKTLGEVGVPVSSIQNLAEVAAEPQFDHRLTFTQIDRPGGKDKVRVVSASHVASPAPPKVQSQPPALGEHTHDVLTELGYTLADIKQMQEDQLI
jgi:formyl-CoA transferase